MGQCLLALGFVFLAMRMIGEGAAGLAAAPETRQLSALLEGHPWIVAMAVTGLAVPLQSSTATIGLGIGLVAGGVLSGGLIVPWIVGTNLGLAVTSLAAGWPTPEGRKLGAANLLIKASAAALLRSFPLWSEQLLAVLPGSELRRIAVFHTGYNLVAALAALPFLRPITRFTALLIGGGPPGELAPRPAPHLDTRAFESPPLALVHATRETLRMADETKSMFENHWRAEATPTAELLRAVQRQDDQIDIHHREIRDYLSHIRETATTADTRCSFTLLGFTNELEAIGDIIDKKPLRRAAQTPRRSDCPHPRGSRHARPASPENRRASERHHQPARHPRSRPGPRPARRQGGDWRVVPPPADRTLPPPPPRSTRDARIEHLLPRRAQQF